MKYLGQNPNFTLASDKAFVNFYGVVPLYAPSVQYTYLLYYKYILCIYTTYDITADK